MPKIDLSILAILAVVLLSVPAIMAGIFPAVERTIGLVIETLWLNSVKGILFWIMVIAVVVYLSALPSVAALMHELSLVSF